MGNQPDTEAMWREVLNGNVAVLQRNRTIFKFLPSEPRCRFCNAPFGGFGAPIARYIFNRKPSSLNPRFCSACDDFAEHFPGGAEIEITMLFADVRGSTSMAEGIRPAEFSRMLNRFYEAAANTLVPTDAWIDKLVGDEIIALFIPGFVGKEHPHAAVHAAQRLLHAVGYGTSSGPWIPIGVGIHTDTVYVGAVGSGGIRDITALGDGMNTTARLVGSAAAGEILISETTAKAANLDTSQLEARQLELKGKAESFDVRVLTVDTSIHA